MNRVFQACNPGNSRGIRGGPVTMRRRGRNRISRGNLKNPFFIEGLEVCGPVSSRWQKACFIDNKTLFLVLFMPAEKGKDMPGEIQWETDPKEALKRSKSEGKPVLLFFHNPG